MTSTVLPLIAAAIGPIFGGLVVYVLGQRASSGQIRHSNAEVVWDAAESIRHDLIDLYKTQTLELAAVKAELATVNAQLAAIRGRLEG